MVNQWYQTVLGGSLAIVSSLKSSTLLGLMPIQSETLPVGPRDARNCCYVWLSQVDSWGGGDQGSSVWVCPLPWYRWGRDGLSTAVHTVCSGNFSPVLEDLNMRLVDGVAGLFVFRCWGSLVCAVADPLAKKKNALSGESKKNQSRPRRTTNNDVKLNTADGIRILPDLWGDLMVINVIAVVILKWTPMDWWNLKPHGSPLFQRWGALVQLQSGTPGRERSATFIRRVRIAAQRRWARHVKRMQIVRWPAQRLLTCTEIKKIYMVRITTSKHVKKSLN